MMKKKIREQEKSKHNQSNKAADNKDNTEKSKNTDEINGKETASDVEKDSASESGKAEDGSDKLSNEVKTLTEKLADMQDKYIRLSAEYDNYRKRTLREKMDLSKYAGENIFLKIIPFK